MKKLLIFASALLFCQLCYIPAQSQQLPTVGMPRKELIAVFPRFAEEQFKGKDVLCRGAEIWGLTDDFCFRLKNDSVEWMYFHNYIDDLTKDNFKLCLSATRGIISDYTGIYGAPDTVITGDTTFVDPYVKHHWGYNVLEARWYDAYGQKIGVEFTFMGGKGEYALLVTINYFDKNYPYFH
jgi:hypothetical protein